MEKNGKNLSFITTFAAIVCFILLSVTVSAKETERFLTTVPGGQDLIVNFVFDKTPVDITFLSPSGQRKTVSDKDVYMEEGKLWRTYKIENAEAGDWSVIYDLWGNDYIDYSIINDNLTLTITDFSFGGIVGDSGRVTFAAEGGSDEYRYRYELDAVPEAEGEEKARLSEGSADTGETVEETFSMENLSSGAYTLMLNIYTEVDRLELFDSKSLDPITYTNPNEPAPMADYSLILDAGNLILRADWENFVPEGAEGFKLRAFADDEQIFIADYEAEETGAAFSYPKDAAEIRVELCCKLEGLWSEVLVKTLDPSKTGLTLITPEVTADSQVVLEYDIAGNGELTISINDMENTIQVRNTGRAAADLTPGANAVYAELTDAKGNVYIVNADIYRDAAPPELHLYDDPDGKVFLTDTADILGTVGRGNSLMVNGEAAEIKEDGSFVVTVALTEGANTVSLEASDVNGNASGRTLTLYRGEGAGDDEAEEEGDEDRTVSAEEDLSARLIPMFLTFGVSGLLIIFALLFYRRKK